MTLNATARIAYTSTSGDSRGSRPAPRDAVRQARPAQRPMRTDRVQGLTLATVNFTRHVLTQAASKGFTAEQIAEAIERPYKVTEVTRHPGQSRYCGGGVAVVIDDLSLNVITIYLDGVVTPMRDDQRNDAAARSSRRLAAAR